jgi:hypothetical protein
MELVSLLCTVCVLFVYCFEVQIVGMGIRGPRLPVVIQWGSAEVKRLRNTDLENTHCKYGSKLCCTSRSYPVTFYLFCSWFPSGKFNHIRKQFKQMFL